MLQHSNDLIYNFADFFPIGYYQFHPDVNLNFRINARCQNRLFGRATDKDDMIDEIREVCPKIHDYSDVRREFLALSERALDRGKRRKGAAYLRLAEFFMFDDDRRREPARKKYLQLIREEFGIQDSDHIDVPYQNGKLSVYKFDNSEAWGTIVLFGGYDSYIEDWFPMQLYLRNAGLNVIAFEGPGQGSVLEDFHIPMTHEWEKPVKAIIDYFHLEDVTLMGLSLGGCLVMRAAAYEPRVSRVIALDVLTDLFEGIARQSHDYLSALLDTEDASTVNTMVEQGMKNSLVVEWGIKQGLHVTATETPYDFLKQAKLYRTDNISHLVKQDVLLLAGTEDHYVPLHQFYDQIHSLSNVRSLTARLFSREEQAQNHCQVGNIGLALNVIISWMQSLRSRNCQQTH